MDYLGSENLSSALSDFRSARNRAILKEIVSKFTGEPIELLSYEEVRKQLRIMGSSDRGLRDIPLDAIVGSVGRYVDFTRGFLPRKSTDEYRWAKVKLATADMAGLPPIEVYQIGDAFFVKDGNHRVSVARQLGTKSIQAYVTEVRTRVPLEPDTQPDELILKAEYAEFLETTELDHLRPNADLQVTVPGQYPILLEHIAVHRYYMGINQNRHIPYEEAVGHWYDAVYLPIIQPIREQGLLHYFPRRTETDLYLWIAEYRAQLESELGWEVESHIAATDLINRAKADPEPIFNRIGTKILDVLTQGKLDSGPPPGEWRETKQTLLLSERMFANILVPISGEPASWYALEQAMVLARREQAVLHGLHVTASDAGIEESAAQAVRDEFNRRCAEGNLPGQLAIKSGEVLTQITNQARLNDIIVISLLYPPPSQLLARLDSGFRDLIARTPRPVLAVPQVVSELNRALLAYDGSPKAQEALFVAAYIAAEWHIPLHVVTVADNEQAEPDYLVEARIYLKERQIDASYITVESPPADAILSAAQQTYSDLIIMGGYGLSPVVELVLGSVVDQVLRGTTVPVLICR